MGSGVGLTQVNAAAMPRDYAGDGSFPEEASMYRDLMLAVTGSAADQQALAAASALAAHLDARLAVVEAVDLPLPSPTPWGITPDTMLGELHEELLENAEQRAASMRARLAQADLRSEVRVAAAKFTDAPRMLALHARHADLAVMTAARQPQDEAVGLVAAVFGALLFESGRPVLVVPPHHAIEVPFGHAVVAWQPTREAARALHDALPLLARAGSIDVVLVDPEPGEHAHGEQPGADIAAHLVRHGLAANVVVKQRQGRSVANVLLAHAAESNARLLVAGGYGHSRLREWALGGTTRELLRAICLPILFSH